MDRLGNEPLGKKKRLTLHPEQLRKSLEDTIKYTCERCGFTCAKCKMVKLKTAFSSSRWEKRYGRPCLCLTCEAEVPMFTCHQCKVSQPRHAFGESMWANRNRQQCVCLTCARPQCTGPQCSTCKVCRDPNCPKGKKCQRQVTELNHKQRPTSFQEVQAYLCSKCKPITCRCGKQLPKKMQKKALQEARQYICPDCQTKDLRERDRKRKVF